MTEADKLELEIMEKAQQLAALRKEEAAKAQTPVTDYVFDTLEGQVTLHDLFAGRERLLMIHNMGQGCRYCTLWADGINGIIDHLEDALCVVLVSKDPPETQRRMAMNRGWKFRTVSHGGGAYMEEQCAMGEYANYPGAATYEMRDGKIYKTAKTAFGPGDLYSPMWHFLALAGIAHSDWTPQFRYWHLPEKLDDGGENLRD